MPWNNYYYRRRRRYRPRYRFWRRPRKTFRRRYYRKRWVRNKFYKRKLTKIKLTQYQPKAIRRCKIKGLICLFQCTNERVAFNFDMYELSTVPEHLPGGGGFGIKNFSLEALYSEHRYAHNIWTKTNNDLPLCRYTGCSFKLYQSERTDYIFSFSNTLPLQSNMGMYNTLQPSIHGMLQHKILVPSRQTYRKKKPYIRVKVGPPTQLTNKWYFQQDLAKTPLVMIRTSAFSMEHYYLHPQGKSTNITIETLNTKLIKNTNFKNPPTSGYVASTGPGTSAVYLYSTNKEVTNLSNIKIKDLIYLGDTKNNVKGKSWSEAEPSSDKTKWTTENKKYWGNPFYADYLNTNNPVFQSPNSYPYYINKEGQNPNSVAENLTLVSLVHTIRYNPYQDQGLDTKCYFKPTFKDENSWEAPTNADEKINTGLPIWLLLWGYPDFIRKAQLHQHLDTDWVLVIETIDTRPIRNHIVPLNPSFIEGHSAYEGEPNPIDSDRWYPSFNFQTEAYNNICLCGPGTPKIPPNTNIEAKCEYTFYFKWGGHPPPMSTIEDPKLQTTYPIPNNTLQTNSLQNPTSYPEAILYSFDERRGLLTNKAAKRMQKDWTIKTPTITDGTNPFSELPQPIYQTTPEETTSEEEEEETENLFEQLQRQRNKQRLLKQRILKTLKKLQSLE
nr:MAG: ORF1 [TTV-like mini virus]